MECRITPEDRAFREEVRAWLSGNVPKEKLPPIGAEQAAFMRAWQRKQYDAGWAGVAWPKEHGGRGLALVQQVIWYEEYARAGAPDSSCILIALSHGGPTLMVRGTEAQRTFHLPRILKGESIWCQGFSEPNAGSDLAGVQTRGVVDGDYLVVNGQKIWTSFAQVADYQELLIRTDPHTSRHRGLSWIICDMKLPGITVRPIEALDGQFHNCQVFYDNVRIPLENVVGQLNDGWRVALATLSFERGSSFMEYQLRLAADIEALIQLARRLPGRNGKPLIGDDRIASELARLRAQVASLRAATYMSTSRALRQELPGPEGAYLALLYGDLSQASTRLAMDIIGSDGLERPREFDQEGWVQRYLRALLDTIGGGTSEIRRNIIGERVLGLPKDR
jgi:alkylation response protein AidB-like acyl-CoA dehydrogenase